MPTLCDVCLRMFRTGTNPLGMARAHADAGRTGDGNRFHRFCSDEFPHHPSFQSLQSSAEKGCYICLVFFRRIEARAHGVPKPKPGASDGEFGKYRFHCDVQGTSQHHVAFKIAISARWARVMFLAGFTAVPAPGLTDSPALGELPSHTLSDRGIRQVTAWISRCNRFHARCAAARSAVSWFPTRLLDLGTGDSPVVRLIETKNSHPEGPYATLSYCWGTAATVTLTRDALGAFLNLLPESTLPKTFRDTIYVTRRLGLRYLWIDSLCIIQDSADDWRAESSVMGQVYRNGLFDLAATASADSSGGLFFERDPRVVAPAVVMANWEGCPSSAYVVSDQDLWEGGVSDAVLNTRGWVLQERYLSPRFLHFGSDQLYWDCLELQACEAFPGGFTSVLAGRVLPLPVTEQDFTDYGKRFRPSWQQPPLAQYDGYRVWKELVWSYSRTQLSHAKDKLVAFSALAKEARKALHDDYLAGLWRRHLGWELGWTAFQGGSHSRPTAYRAPTWSWASIDGPIDYTYYGDDKSPLVNVLEAQVTPATPQDDTGEVTGGFVRLRGFLYPTSVIREDVMGDLRWDLESDYFGPSVRDDSYILLHHSSEFDTRHYRPDDYHLLGLMLKYDSASKTYTRRGMVRLFDYRGQDPKARRRMSVRDLQQSWRSYAPSIPCEALDEVHGCTITLV